MRVIRLLGVGLATIAVGACIEPQSQDNSNAVVVGALLPFTGDESALGQNIEHALILAADEINAAGGVVGRPLHIVARDTHSDARRGLTACRDLLEQNVVGIIGPQDDTLAEALVPVIRDAQVVDISGGASSPALRTADDNGFWFRTVPSALLYGRALAEKVWDDGIRKLTVLYVNDEYGVGYSNVINFEFGALGGETTPPVFFNAGDPSFLTTIDLLRSRNTDAVAMVAHPSSGSLIIQEWSVLGQHVAWYLTPTLRSDVLLRNTPPGVLDGATGVSPALSDKEPIFAARFAQRWDGEQPSVQAAFYYDAAIILALAIQQAAGDSTTIPSGTAIRDAVITVASPDGTQVDLSNLADALSLVRAGSSVNYQGVSGNVDLDSAGDVLEDRVQMWHIAGSAFVDDGEVTMP